MPSGPESAEGARKQLEVLLLRLTVAIAPLLVLTWLLVPSRAPGAAVTSLLLIPAYTVLALAVIRRRPAWVVSGWSALVLFALQALLVSFQVWAYDRPGGPLWLAFLPCLLIAAARWQLPGVWLALAWFTADRVATTASLPELPPRQLIQELTLELAVMTVVGLLFGFLVRELALHRGRLRASTAGLIAAIGHVGEAILTVDSRGLIAAANPAAGELFGGRPSTFTGRPVDELLPGYGDHLDDVPSPGGRALRHDTWGRRWDGRGFTAEVVTSLIEGDDGLLRILVLRDISELRARTAALSHQASHDALTGLPNRLRFTQELAKRVATARVKAAPLSVLIIDLDGFKEVNDTHGHQVGDLVLQAVARRLRSQVRSDDLVARLGGDEFALLPGPGTPPGGESRIAEKIVRACRDPFMVGGTEIDLGISVGVATFPEHGEDADALMRHADVAMYETKRAGGGWATAIPGRQEERPLIAVAVTSADLRRAIEDGELALRCTPIMNLVDNTLSGVDTDLRWHHPDLGALEPEQFIPVAERTGVIRPLTRSAARLAVEQLATWRDADSDLEVTIPIRERNLRDVTLISMVSTMLREHRLPPARVTLLIHQDATLAPTAAAFVTAASEAGLRLAIEDYGSGSVSLLHLRSMPFTEIRLAARLVGGLGAESADRSVVRALISLAHAFEIKVTAKDVRDDATLQILRDLGCDTVTFAKLMESRPVAAPAGDRSSGSSPPRVEGGTGPRGPRGAREYIGERAAAALTGANINDASAQE